ncbi:hypothetical protein N7530_009762 [Penicillium desertorum]|uniref:Uncharacterized protein n=1 Tax=Penicillium desertorum TaxID=1303715 RepID=A0A9W9WJ91_9EURO|nr:hypothetical protein N7530_009762 [Penicillium desertorum]
MPKGKATQSVAASAIASPVTLARATSQPVSPSPPAVNSPLRASTRRKTRRREALASLGPENRPRQHNQEDSDLVHADCKLIFEKADRDRQQLTAQLKKASEAARKFNAEKVRSNAQLRKLMSELNESNQKNVDLEKRLKESTVDHQIFLLREEHKRILEHLGKLSSSVSRTIDKKRDEFQSTYMSGVKSSSDVAQSSWIQAEQFKLHEDQAFSNEMASMTTTSNSLMGLPPLYTYNAT